MTRGRTAFILGPEVTALEQPSADRCHIARAHVIVREGRVLRRVGNESRHVTVVSDSVPGEDSVLRERDRRDAGNGRQAVAQCMRETCQSLRPHTRAHLRRRRG